MFDLGLAGNIHGFPPAILLLLALVTEAYLGGMAALFRRVPHPVVAIGNLIGLLDRKLNRENRSETARRLRGALAVLAIVILAGALGWAVAWLSLNHTFGWLLEFFLVVSLLAQRSLYEHVRAVGVALGQGVEPGRRAVAHIVGRDVAQLDDHGVARAAIESCAENFGDGVVAPVFWYLVLGLPGMLVYKAVNTMDSMIGYRSAKYRAFGMVAARLDDVLNWVPARLAGLFIAAAATFAPTARPGAALGTMVRQAGRHRSPNAGWPEGAMAGALGLALAGPRRYAQGVVKDPWIGDGTARATARDVGRALSVYVIACVVNMAFAAAIALSGLAFAG